MYSFAIVLSKERNDYVSLLVVLLAFHYSLTLLRMSLAISMLSYTFSHIRVGEFLQSHIHTVALKRKDAPS